MKLRRIAAEPSRMAYSEVYAHAALERPRTTFGSASDVVTHAHAPRLDAPQCSHLDLLTKGAQEKRTRASMPRTHTAKAMGDGTIAGSIWII